MNNEVYVEAGGVDFGECGVFSVNNELLTNGTRASEIKEGETYRVKSDGFPVFSRNKNAYEMSHGGIMARCIRTHSICTVFQKAVW